MSFSRRWYYCPWRPKVNSEGVEVREGYIGKDRFWIALRLPDSEDLWTSGELGLVEETGPVVLLDAEDKLVWFDQQGPKKLTAEQRVKLWCYLKEALEGATVVERS